MGNIAIYSVIRLHTKPGVSTYKTRSFICIETPGFVCGVRIGVCVCEPGSGKPRALLAFQPYPP